LSFNTNSAKLDTSRYLTLERVHHLGKGGSSRPPNGRKSMPQFRSIDLNLKSHPQTMTMKKERVAGKLGGSPKLLTSQKQEGDVKIRSCE